MTAESKVLILATTSAALLLLTRRSLRGFGSHGLYRLLAWIASITLILLNLESWFDEPFRTRQLFSWLLLLLSVVAVTHGSISLYRGRPGVGRGDTSLIGPERTTQLVQSGAYRYIRHPMYSSLLLASLGVFLKDPSWAGAVLTLLTILWTVLAAKTEEKENLLYFGDAYRSYMGRTKMFVPFLL